MHRLLLEELGVLQRDADALPDRRMTSLPRHRTTEHGDLTRTSAACRPSQISTVVVLPAPLGPSKSEDLATSRRSRSESVHGDDLLTAPSLKTFRRPDVVSIAAVVHLAGVIIWGTRSRPRRRRR